jgi:hypothetical protein
MKAMAFRERCNHDGDTLGHFFRLTRRRVSVELLNVLGQGAKESFGT